jgi:hypothetical protein
MICLNVELRRSTTVGEENNMAWITKLHDAQAAISAPRADPWLLPLGRVRGQINFDGLERVSSQTLLDLLEIPQRSRRAPVFRRIAKLMAELGWTPVRVRDLTRGGYKEQVRGYARDARCRSTGPN